MKRWQQTLPILFPQAETGTVEKEISLHQVGRAKWRGSYYPAKLYECSVTLLPNDTIAIVGREGITLLTKALATSRETVLPQTETRPLQNLTPIVVQKHKNNLPPSLASNPTTGLRVILVRHGETDWNLEQRLQGHIDVPLNATGRQQAQAVGDFLSAIPIDYAFSSSLSRAQATTSLILGGRTVPHQAVRAFEELSHGDWNGMLETQIQRLYPQDYYLWQTHPLRADKPNGETLPQVWERVIPAWDALINDCMDAKPKTVLVVAHKWINQIILCHVCGFGLEHFGKFRQDNCAINVIDYPFGVKGKAYLQATNLTPLGSSPVTV